MWRYVQDRGRTRAGLIDEVIALKPRPPMAPYPVPPGPASLKRGIDDEVAAADGTLSGPSRAGLIEARR